MWDGLSVQFDSRIYRYMLSVRIDPHLGDLEWVEGTFPTPYGAVKIRHEKAPDGTVKSRVEVPRGVKAELVKHNR